MKTKATITIDPGTLKLLKKQVKDGKFRNLSHAFDYYAKQGIERDF